MLLRNITRTSSTVNLHRGITVLFSKLGYCTATGAQEKNVENAPVVEKKPENISKAMKSYLERAQAHDEFMKQQKEEYQIGKRHLANMMGEDPETFTQEDVDRAIEYLFPSGLFEKKARPFMKPPEEVFPQRKAAEFDSSGRPFHFLFYTGRCNFYQLLYDIVEQMNEIMRFEDAMNRKGVKPDPHLAMETSGYQWLDKETLEKELVEKISDREYSNFVATLERLLSLSFSYKAKDFISKYRNPLLSKSQNLEIPKVKYGEDGRAYITTYECLRKKARGHVTIRSPGTGQITVNEQDIKYFHDMQSREQDKAVKVTLPASSTPTYYKPIKDYYVSDIKHKIFL